METFQLGDAAAVAYQHHLVPRLFEPLADRLTTAAPPSGADRVLDVACGTGVVARRVAGHAAAVTGIDINPAMVQAARRSAPALDWRIGDAQAVELPPASYDIAYCQQGLQFMADPAAALQAIARVLRPGGRLVVALWRPVEQAPGFAALVAALDNHVGTAAGDVLRAPFLLGDHVPVARMIEAAGFDRPRVLNHYHAVTFGSVAELVQCEIDATPLAQLATGWPPGATGAITRETEQRLRTYTGDDGVVFPIGAFIAIATT